MVQFKKLYKHIFLFLLFAFSLVAVIDYFFEQQEKKYLLVQTDLLQNKYNTNYKYFKIMSNDIHSMYSDKKELISLFSQAQKSSMVNKKQIRLDMHALLKKRYSRLVNMGIDKIHFISPDNTSFLRMHAKEKYGDDLSSIRPTVLKVNKTQKPHEGYEIGVFGGGFRFVFPLFSAGKEYIGCVDIAYDATKLLENLTDKSVLERHFLVLNSLVETNLNKAVALNHYEPSIENKSYMHRKETHNETYNQKIQKVFENSKINEEIETLIKTKKPFSIYGNYNYDSINITFLPILDSTNNKVTAYLTLYTDADYIDMLILEKYYTLLLVISILFLIFLFSVYFTLTQQKLEKMAHFDKLTNLPNRAYFQIELDLELKRAKRSKENFSLMFIDLDGFKYVNDTYGHNVGDELLIKVSRVLETVVREVDIVSRIGGDEFVILVTGVRTSKDSTAVARKIIEKLNEDFIIHKNKINIGASIGIANYPIHGTDAHTLIKNSDNAMYDAKKSGKNKYKLARNEEKNKEK